MATEYIEREAAKRELLSWAVNMNHPEYLMRDDALHVIDSIPAADVVEVVRCKDCKYFNDLGCAIDVVDDTDKPTENDFCSFGVRSDSND